VIHETIDTKNAPAAIGPYSQAVRAGNLLFISGQIPIDPRTGEQLKGSLQAQTRQVIENVKAIVEAAGGSLENIVKTTLYLQDLGGFVTVNEVYAEYFTKHRPARATVEVSALPKDVGIEMEAIAVL